MVDVVLSSIQVCSEPLKPNLIDNRTVSPHQIDLTDIVFNAYDVSIYLDWDNFDSFVQKKKNKTSWESLPSLWNFTSMKALWFPDASLPVQSDIQKVEAELPHSGYRIDHGAFKSRKITSQWLSCVFLSALKYLLPAAGCAALWTPIGGIVLVTVQDFRMLFIMIWEFFFWRRKVVWGCKVGGGVK